MLIFFVLLTIGFVFELGKKALVIYSRQSNFVKKSDVIDFPILATSLFLINDESINQLFIFPILGLIVILLAFSISLYNHIDHINNYIIINIKKIYFLVFIGFNIYLSMYLFDSF